MYKNDRMIINLLLLNNDSMKIDMKILKIGTNFSNLDNEKYRCTVLKKLQNELSQ